MSAFLPFTRGMSSESHVSDSVCSGEGVAGVEDRADMAPEDPADKELRVVEWVVQSVFAAKKRCLTTRVNAAMEALHVAGASELDCGCRKCGPVPCMKRVQLREKHFQVLAREQWPALEHELVSFLAHTICGAQQNHAGLTRENARLTLELATAQEEHALLKAQIADVARALMHRVDDAT